MNKQKELEKELDSIFEYVTGYLLDKLCKYHFRLEMFNELHSEKHAQTCSDLFEEEIMGEFLHKWGKLEKVLEK